MAKPKQKALKHRWGAVSLQLDFPRDSQMVEWCVDCGILRRKPWQALSKRHRDPTVYFVPYADFPKLEGSSHNHWAHREMPPCRPVPGYVLIGKK